MRSKRWTYIFLFHCVSKLFAQDFQFTQFYASPMMLNPAFTGLIYEHRFTAAYRNQWPGIKRSFTTYMATYDYNISNLNSGIGGFILQDRSGTSNLVTTLGGINFAYRIKVDKFSELRLGASVAMAQKKVDNTNLVFNDQLITGSSVSQDALSTQNTNYADIGLGAVYNSANYWIGATAKHVNQPNTSLTSSLQALPIYMSVHGGYRYIISASGKGKTKLEEFVSASVNYRHQQKYDQLDIGAYYFRSKLNVGLWYRGLPLKRYKVGFPTRESVAILVGFEIPDKNFKVGYSYDITISRLGINSTQGAHELTLVYEIFKKNKRNRRVLVSCPKF